MGQCRVAGEEICQRLTLRIFIFFFQAEDGIRDLTVTGVQTCALPILRVDIQMSRLGRPFGADTLPGRLDVKTNIRPSKDRLGCCSKAAELSGAPGFSGVDHGSFALRRVDTRRSARPIPPARAPRWNQMSFPS